ncbi:hypothetical protein ACVBIL_06160 [Shewanella sp. 125m-7]
MNYLVNNKRHHDHVHYYGTGAIFDIEPHQHGHTELVQAKVGDSMFVINNKLNVEFEHEITKIETVGSFLVFFGRRIKRPSLYYPTFIRQRKIESAKISEHKMLRGFNAVAFS